jgi:hypothetical protein
MSGLLCAVCEWFAGRLVCAGCGRLLCHVCWEEGGGRCGECQLKAER